MKLIEVVADAGHLDTLTGLAEQYGALDYWYSQTVEDQRRSVRMLVDDAKRQTVLDALQNLLSTSDNARIVVLALASGAAAVLSLTSGLASALVGVMVAVALLPPTATLGMVLASGQFEMAAGAALLLAVNIVCVNLSANLVFLVKGVRPRTWIEKRKARQSAAWIGLFWAVALAVLLFAVYARELVDV